jgi:hypothetical protein
MACGATAVAVGTASFRDPAAGERVRRELEMIDVPNTSSIPLPSTST